MDPYANDELLNNGDVDGDGDDFDDGENVQLVVPHAEFRVDDNYEGDGEDHDVIFSFYLHLPDQYVLDRYMMYSLNQFLQIILSYQHDPGVISGIVIDQDDEKTKWNIKFPDEEISAPEDEKLCEMSVNYRENKNHIIFWYRDIIDDFDDDRPHRNQFANNADDDDDDDDAQEAIDAEFENAFNDYKASKIVEVISHEEFIARF